MEEKSVELSGRRVEGGDGSKRGEKNEIVSGIDEGGKEGVEKADEEAFDKTM